LFLKLLNRDGNGVFISGSVALYSSNIAIHGLYQMFDQAVGLTRKYDVSYHIISCQGMEAFRKYQDI